MGEGDRERVVLSARLLTGTVPQPQDSVTSAAVHMSSCLSHTQGDDNAPVKPRTLQLPTHLPACLRATAAAKKGSDSNLLARLDSYSTTPYTTGGSAAHMYASAYNGGSIPFSNGSTPYAAAAGEANGSLNGGLGHAAKAPMSPRNLGLDFLGAWGMHALKAGERNGGFKLAAPQYAATLMAALVLAVHTVPQVWLVAMCNVCLC